MSASASASESLDPEETDHVDLLSRFSPPLFQILVGKTVRLLVTHPLRLFVRLVGCLVQHKGLNCGGGRNRPLGVPVEITMDVTYNL